MNGILSVLLRNLFRFHQEAVRALRLEFSRFSTVGVREFLCKNGFKVSREKQQLIQHNVFNKRELVFRTSSVQHPLLRTCIT